MKRINARLDQNSCESFLFILYKQKDLEMSRMQQHDLIWQQQMKLTVVKIR